MSTYQPCPCPEQSPWGKVQTKQELAPGIWSVSTAGHGGIKLSRGRNAAVPKYMRAEGGWYEEDEQWSIAAVVHPIGFQRKLKDGRSEFDCALETFRNSFPSEWEQFSGMTLQPGMSRARDREIWLMDNHANFIVSSACGAWHHGVPEGMVGVHATRLSDGEKKQFLVSAHEYANPPDKQGFVIDLTRHEQRNWD